MKYFFPVATMLVMIAVSANALQFEPPVAPLVPPEAPATNERLPNPLPPALNEYKVPKEDAGYFYLHKNAELSGFYMPNRSRWLGLVGLQGGLVNFRIADPWYLGGKLGLAQDAVEFKAGSGLILGFDVNNRPYFSIPGQIEATLYLKEGSFFDLDPFVGAGLNMNILGTDFQFGGLGINIYCGVLKEMWTSGNKVELSIGYGSYQINNARNIEGLYLQISQPVRL
ncbi:MAG: hypothetical protein AABZ57_01220 [Candidatus Margulisiibacteriota bacterium]